MTTSPYETAILRFVAHSSAEDTDSRDCWCRWRTVLKHPWAWHDYKPLVASGLLDRQETWKDVLLRLTEAGWAAVNDE